MRISRDQMYMLMARAASMRSTCFRASVGAILVEGNRRVVSIGYNGPASGEPHCTGSVCHREGQGCHRALHAETNALDMAGLTDGELTMYCTHSPCMECANKMLQRGVARIVYENEYRDRTPVDYLIGKGMIIQRLSPSGFLIDAQTKDLVQQ